MSNVTDTRPAEEDIRVVTMMLIKLVLSMERSQFQALDKLQQDFITDLTDLNIGLTGIINNLSVFFFKFIINSLIY